MQLLHKVVVINTALALVLSRGIHSSACYCLAGSCSIVDSQQVS